MEETSPRFFGLKRVSEGFLREKGSRFYAYAYPVAEPVEIDNYLGQLKKRYYDARHHCYAYRLGERGETSFSTDDREPANSAGPPILAALRSADLTNALVIVVRYFGGTKLGIRGLIEAYRTAAQYAIEANECFEIIPQVQFQLAYAYEQTSEINRILHPFSFRVIDSMYTDSVSQTLSIRMERFPELEKRMLDAGFVVQVIS